MAAHGLLQLEQAKQNKTNDSLTFEQTQALEEACFLVNYSPKQEPKQELKSQNKVPQSAQGYDVSPSVLSGCMHSLLYGV